MTLAISHKLRSLIMTGALLVVSAHSAVALDRGELKKLISQGSQHLQSMQNEYEQIKKDKDQRDYARKLKKNISREQNKIRKAEQKVRTLADRVITSNNINFKDKDGRTLIMLVAALGIDEATNLVLAENPDLSIADKNNKLAIDYEMQNGGHAIKDKVKQMWETALTNGNIGELQKALSYGADPNWGSGNKNALETAILDKNNDLISQLLLNGAEADRVTSEGISIIELAIKEDNKKAVILILNELKDIDIILSDGNTLLQRFMQDNDSEALGTVLYKMAAEGKSETEDGFSYFCMIIRFAPPECSIKVSEQNKGLLNKEDSEGNLPLHEAARRGNVELYRKMVELGASPTQKNSRGETVLMHAVLSASADTISEVLKNISPEILKAKDSDGHTAHYYAKLAQDKAATQALNNAGLHPNNKD